MMIFDKCNRCGKELGCYPEMRIVTCVDSGVFEHDTKRYVCDKCYKKFQKYIRKHYDKFFTYLSEELKGENNE